MAGVIARSPEQRSGRLMMIAAVILAGIAAVIVFVALNEAAGSSGEKSTTGSSAAAAQMIVVASRDIEVNTVLSLDMLEIRSFAPEQVIAGASTATEAVVGLPVRFPVQQGEQITAAKVGFEAIVEEQDIALVLERGERAFAVEASEVTAVGGLLLPGNFVDVIAVFKDPETGIERASTVLQNIEVLSVAQEAQQPIPAAQDAEGLARGDASVGQGVIGQRPDDVERQPAARSVTLAVSPEQAQLLATLQGLDRVEIWLSLRPVDDEETVPIGQTELSPIIPPALLQ